jgi:hypothetical protein
VVQTELALDVVLDFYQAGRNLLDFRLLALQRGSNLNVDDLAYPLEFLEENARARSI